MTGPLNQVGQVGRTQSSRPAINPTMSQPHYCTVPLYKYTSRFLNVYTVLEFVEQMAFSSGLTLQQTIGVAFGTLVVYAATLVVYRLYLSPLSKFPGPRLAASTFWYEFYYDVVKLGQYTWKIGELHKQYGNA